MKPLGKDVFLAVDKSLVLWLELKMQDVTYCKDSRCLNEAEFDSCPEVE